MAKEKFRTRNGRTYRSATDPLAGEAERLAKLTERSDGYVPAEKWLADHEPDPIPHIFPDYVARRAARRRRKRRSAGGYR